MKKIFSALVLLALSVSAFAQGGLDAGQIKRGTVPIARLDTAQITSGLKNKLTAVQASIPAQIATAVTPLVTSTYVNNQLGNYVLKITGKGLSTNDYTLQDQTKVATIHRVAINSKFLLIGDSMIANRMTSYALSGSTPPSGTAQNLINSNFATNALIIAGNNLFVPVDGNRGVNGEGVINVINRMAGILALKPAAALVSIGTNDLSGGYSSDYIISGLKTIYAGLRAANCAVLPVTIPKRFGSYSLSAAQETTRQTVNAFIRTQDNFADVESLDNAVYFQDGLHPNIIGSYAMGKIVAVPLANMVKTGSVTDAFFADTFNNNPLLAGTSGSKTGSSGTVANNYDLQGNEAGGATVVGSKSTPDDKQVITVSGTYTGNGMKSQLQYYINLNGQFAASDQIEAFVEIEVLNNMVGVSTVDAILTLVDSGFSTTYVNAQAFYSGDATVNCQLVPGKYTLRVPPSVIGSASAANLVLRLGVWFKNASGSSPVSAQIKINRIGIRKIN
ncbi:MAG: hypothetical protein EOO61_07445 [Hymenobacter sp.]|nr:MAG: hypothetical protein EOO61_07445 [Hymenobacter sp.]